MADVTITYDKDFEFYEVDGDTIIDLERFIAITLELGKTIDFEVVATLHDDLEEYFDDDMCDYEMDQWAKRHDCEV